MYELEDHNVLRSAAFLDEVRYRPSPRREKASGGYIGRNFLLNGYRQIYPMMINPVELTMGMSPYLQMGRMDIPAAMEEEFNAWYNTVYIPGYLTIPGCLRARRYICIEGQPKYLTVYEFENPTVSERDDWRAMGNSNPWTHRVRPHLQHGPGSPGLYARIYPDPVV